MKPRKPKSESKPTPKIRPKPKVKGKAKTAVKSKAKHASSSSSSNADAAAGPDVSDGFIFRSAAVPVTAHPEDEVKTPKSDDSDVMSPYSDPPTGVWCDGVFVRDVD